MLVGDNLNNLNAGKDNSLYIGMIK